jgi:hypothetical protein
MYGSGLCAGGLHWPHAHLGAEQRLRPPSATKRLVFDGSRGQFFLCAIVGRLMASGWAK